MLSLFPSRDEQNIRRRPSPRLLTSVFYSRTDLRDWMGSGGGEIRLPDFSGKRSLSSCTTRGHRGDGDDGRDEDEDDVPLRSECIDQGADDLVRTGSEARGPLAAAERRGTLQLPLGLPSRPPPAGGPVRGLPAEGRRTPVEGVVVVVRVVVVLPSPPNPDFSLSDRPAHGLVPTALQRVQNSHEHCGS